VSKDARTLHLLFWSGEHTPSPPECNTQTGAAQNVQNFLDVSAARDEKEKKKKIREGRITCSTLYLRPALFLSRSTPHPKERPTTFSR
jgi:hypothetical protein